MDQNSEFIRKYYSIYRYGMTSIGAWPYQSKISARIAQILFCIQHASIFIPEVIKLFESTHNFDLIIESIPPIFYNVIIGVMYGTVLYHRPKIIEILEKIHRDWENLKDEKERQILTDYADVGKSFTWMYVGMCAFTIVLFCAFPLFPVLMDYIVPLNESRPKMPLYRTEFFVDEQKYFFSILAHNYVTTYVGMIALVNTDVYLANFVQHICGMLAILRRRLENTHREKLGINELDDEIFHETVDCLKMHNNILDLLQTLHGTWTFTLGVLVIILVVLMSFTGLVVLLKWGQWTEVLRFGLFTAAELFHIFTFSYHSQTLIDHNEQVFNTIRCSGWYQSSLRTRGLINMMLLRCKKPFQIFCMTFPLSMENFTLIIKTSFSYFTVVKSTL